jgi:hypothetical protein
MMTKLVAALTIASLTCSLALPASAAPTAEQLTALVKKVEANAKTWIEQDQEDKDLANALNVKYDETNLQDLTTACNASRKELVSVYVALKLLSPLAPGGAAPLPSPELARKYLPLVKSLDGRFKCQTLPVYGKDALTKYHYSQPGKMTEDVARALEAMNKLRDEKIAKDKVIAQNNKLVCEFRRLYARMLLAADDPKEDAALGKLFTDYEGQALADYDYIVALLAGNAKAIKVDRAKKFYEEIDKAVPAMKWKMQTYVDYGTTTFEPDQNSVSGGGGVSQQFWDNLNALGAVVGAAKITLPKYEDVTKAQDLIKLWRKNHPGNSIPPEGDINKWLEEQKKKGK